MSLRRSLPVVVLLLAACGGSAVPASGTASPSAKHTPVPTAAGVTIITPGPSPDARAAGSQGLLPVIPGQGAALPAMPPGVPFTGHLIIAENSSHSRVVEVNAAGQVTWTFSTNSPVLAHPLGPPDDVFYVPGSNNRIMLSSENGQGILQFNRTTGKPVWQLGAYYQIGDSANRFHNPDDAVPSADGTVWLADIVNCRILHFNGSTGAVIGMLGGHGCRHNPPYSFDMPNGAFPTADGSLVVTEIGGQYVSWLNPNGTVLWSHHVPAAYPSDAMGLPDGSVLFTDYSYPGSIYRMSPTGQIMWSYSPRGALTLDHPSIAIPIASNRIAICDDFGNRIIVVDPSTNKIVWQWSGSGSIHLLRPDGVDYRPS